MKANRMTNAKYARRLVGGANSRNRREEHAVTYGTAIRDLRRRVVEQYPDWTAAQIEERVQRLMARGMRPIAA